MQNKLQITSTQVAFLLLVAYCSISAATVIGYSARLLHNPWENTYFESPQSYAAIYAAETGKLYIPMSQPPYTPQAYAPLYYAIDACIAQLAHLDVDLFIFYARLISFLAFLLSGLLVYLICRAADISRIYSILASLMVLGQPDFLGWNVSPRPDMLYILAMLVSLYCALKWADHPWLGYGAAGFLAGIAFLIKQPGIAVAMAIFAALLIEKKFKEAAILSASAAAPVAITFGILYWHKDPFFQQIMFVGNSIWSFTDAGAFVRNHLLTPYWFVPAAIGALGFWQAVKMGSKPKMIAAFALANWFMGFATLLQVGGYMNYLLPGLAGCALMLSYSIHFMKEHSRLITALALASAALIWATSTAYAYGRGLGNYFWHPPEASPTWLRPFRVLSDQTTMNLHGREPVLLDPFGAHVLELNGHWDSTPVVEDLDRGAYDLIILTRMNFLHVIPDFRGISYFSPNEVRIINSKYEVLCSTMRQVVLKPRGREVQATPEMFGKMFSQKCGTGFRERPMDLKVAPGSR